MRQPARITDDMVNMAGYNGSEQAVMSKVP